MTTGRTISLPKAAYYLDKEEPGSIIQIETGQYKLGTFDPEQCIIEAFALDENGMPGQSVQIDFSGAGSEIVYIGRLNVPGGTTVEFTQYELRDAMTQEVPGDGFHCGEGQSLYSPEQLEELRKMLTRSRGYY